MLIKKIKNILSMPFKNDKFFHNYQKFFNHSSSGYILSFHDLSPETFESHIQALSPAKPIKLNELIERYKNGKTTKDCFAITFDDGVKKTVLENWKICKKNKWPVTFYLPTDYINGDNLPFQKIELLNHYLEEGSFDLPILIKDKKKLLKKKLLIRYLYNIIYKENDLVVKSLLDHFINFIPEKFKKSMPSPISWREIKEINKSVYSSFQSHGVSHTACSTLSESRLKDELIESKNIIEQNLNDKVNSFCYPYGSSKTISKLSEKLVSEIYENATTLIRGKLKNSRLHYLPRIDLYEDNTNALARLKVALS